MGEHKRNRCACGSGRKASNCCGKFGREQDVPGPYTGAFKRVLQDDLFSNRSAEEVSLLREGKVQFDAHNYEKAAEAYE